MKASIYKIVGQLFIVTLVVTEATEHYSSNLNCILDTVRWLTAGTLHELTSTDVEYVCSDYLGPCPIVISRSLLFLIPERVRSSPKLKKRAWEGEGEGDLSDI